MTVSAWEQYFHVEKSKSHPVFQDVHSTASKGMVSPLYFIWESFMFCGDIVLAKYKPLIQRNIALIRERYVACVFLHFACVGRYGIQQLLQVDTEQHLPQSPEIVLLKGRCKIYPRWSKHLDTSSIKAYSLVDMKKSSSVVFELQQLITVLIKQ